MTPHDPRTSATLHVTNGDAAAGLLRVAGFGPTVLPWRDVLCEGPVPRGLSLGELCDVRARYLASRGWGSLTELRAAFVQRNETLGRFRRHDEVALWFEHDLYDQLQILQILDRFSRRDLSETRLSLICIGDHPSVSDFRGLGDLAPEHVAPLYDWCKPVTAAMSRPSPKRPGPPFAHRIRAAWNA